MKHYLLVLLACFLAVSVFSIENNTGSSEIVFSEMTIDSPPGDDGSWVELYNRSDKEIRLVGYTIVCNDKLVFSFSNDDLIINPKELVLVSFIKNENKVSAIRDIFLIHIKAPVYPETVKTSPILIPKKSGMAERCPFIKQRSPGYCALFKDTDLVKHNLVDYVFWGRSDFAKNYDSLSKKYNQWAKDISLWPGFGGIAIGIDPFPGDAAYPGTNIVLQRKLFTQLDRIECWEVKMLAESTPGNGNLWMRPYPLSSHEFFVGNKFKISGLNYFDHRFFHFMKGEDIRIRLQIAKDPHFEEIIYNKLIPPTTTIEDYEFKLGTYFARVRIDTDKVSTDWSPVSSFRYVEKEKNENEE
ncbi:MAG: lamin tail domain-containing protein [Candidatus Aminicenantes bacterium]|nr:lamin tail domain-containing protein [Candidatus Aminicenantes bacterium]